MTPLQQIKAYLIKLALHYGRALTDEELIVFSEYLAPRLKPQEVAQACSVWLDSGEEFFPRPISKLFLLIKPPANDEADAREAATRILAAVSKFDRYHSQAPREYMGELAWHVVVAQGGWYSVCARVDESGSMYQAQLRDLALATIKRIRAGQADKAPALPSSGAPKQIENQNRVTQLIGHALKTTTTTTEVKK